MTRKMLMITTAIMALASAPAVYAQGTGTAPSQTLVQQNQQKLQAPGSSLTTGGSATLNRQPMTRDLQSGKTTTGQVSTGQAATGEVKTGEMKMGEMNAHKSMKMGEMNSHKSMKMGGRASSKMHRTSASANHRGQAYREMNGREVQMTRDLNRQGLSGQQAMAPNSGTMMMAPNSASTMTPGQGVSGPANTADNPTTTK